jgi:uncharacterized protein YndB with AHSA1/START domain
MDYDIQHETFVFERLCPAPIERVYAAFSDPTERARWSAPSNDAAFVYDEADFREGGVDRFRCGSKEAPQYTGQTAYLCIASPNLVVSSETVESGGRKLMSSLITTELETQGAATRIKMTVQVTSLFGQQMIAGTKIGNDSALDNLVEQMAASSDQ